MTVNRTQLPLNGLRAFEAAARHLSFTRAAIELCVTQAAISQQVKQLEDRLGQRLFRRLPRGLSLTDEGLALLPTVTESFDRIGQAIERIGDARPREVLNIGAVSTFANGWLFSRLGAFSRAAPHIDLRIFTNNNRIDLAAEGLDGAIRFGDGAWHGTRAEWLLAAPLTVLCAPQIAQRLRQPADLLKETLLRSYRADEWSQWLAKAGAPSTTVRGPVFDSSIAMIEAAEQSLGLALAPPSMFTDRIEAGALVQPFAVEVSVGGYWLTWLGAKPPSSAMAAFREWITETCRAVGD